VIKQDIRVLPAEQDKNLFTGQPVPSNFNSDLVTGSGKTADVKLGNTGSAQTDAGLWQPPKPGGARNGRCGVKIDSTTEFFMSQ